MRAQHISSRVSAVAWESRPLARFPKASTSQFPMTRMPLSDSGHDKAQTDIGDPEVWLLSIDIDGNDYWLWKHFTRCQPKIVVIEFNPTIPSHVEVCALLACDKQISLTGFV